MEKYYGRVRAVKGLYDNILTDFENPALLIIRYLGVFILVFVLFTQFVFRVTGVPDLTALTWMIPYAIYNLVLLIFHRKKVYDLSLSRFIRQLINICFFSWALILFSRLNFLFFLLYLIPTFAALIYYPDRIAPGAGMFALCTLGFYLSAVLFSPAPMTLPQFLLALSLLLGLNLALWISSRWGIKNSTLLESITTELDQQTDLEGIFTTIASFFNDLLLIDRTFILLNNLGLGNDEYFTHFCFGTHISQKDLLPAYLTESHIFQSGRQLSQLTAEQKNEEIARLKNLLEGVSSFEHALGEPLLGRDGKVFGAILLFPSQRVDSVRANKAHQISTIAGNAIENWFFFRRMKINQAVFSAPDGDFALCLDEDHVIQTLIRNVKQRIPATEECFVHRYDYARERLDPKMSLKKGCLVPWKIKDRPSASGNLKMNLHSGIAGNALRLQEPVRVGNVNHHPWFTGEVKENISSLLAVPLIDSGERLIGAISLNSPQPGAFHLEDEIALVGLARQASSAISNLRNLSELREHGSLMLKVINRVGRFDLNRSQDEVCAQIVEAATETLGFNIARIRILNRSTGSLETIHTAGVDETSCAQLRSQSLPYEALKPYLQDKHRYGNIFLFDHDDESWQQFAEQYLYIPSELRNKQTGWRAYNACLIELKNQDDEMLGFLSLDCPKDGTIPVEPHRLDAIEAFGSLSARALELASVQQELVEKQASTRSFIGKISERLAQSEDVLRDVGELVVQTGANLLNVEGCSLFEIKDKKVRLINSNYLDMYIDRQKPVSTDPRCGLTAWVAATGEARIFNNYTYRQHSAWAGEVEHLIHLPHGVCQSLMLVPIKHQQEVIGVISLENKLHSGEISDFTANDLKEAEFLASQVAMSIDVVNRYQLVKKWERFGLEDDLHALKGYSQYGVVINSEIALKYLREGKLDKTLEVLQDLARHSRNVQNQLTTLYATVTRKYLEKADFREALEAILEVWKEVLYHQKKYRFDIPVQVDCPKNLNLPPVVRVGMLKIAAEAITNALFYSGILENPDIQIMISLMLDDKHATLEVTDNGQGFDTQVEGYGIQRMRYFAGILNEERYTTRLQIDSGPGKGTQITCKTKLIPIKS